MHNRKKLDRPPSDAEIAAVQKKSQTYASLVQIIFERRRANNHSDETLQLVGKMLKTNPDFYSLWNFRREVLFSMNSTLNEASFESKYAGDNADSIRDQEMSLSTEGIQRNPKSCKKRNAKILLVRLLSLTNFLYCRWSLAPPQVGH